MLKTGAVRSLRPCPDENSGFFEQPCPSPPTTTNYLTIAVTPDLVHSLAEAMSSVACLKKQPPYTSNEE